MKQVRAEIWTADALRRIAHVIGRSSAAQKALDELTRRKSAGEDVACYIFSNKPQVFVVGPRLHQKGPNQ